MLIVFWGIHRIAHYCWPSKENTFDSPLFGEERLSALAQKMQPNSKKTRRPLALIHRDNAMVHTTRATQGKLDISRFKYTPRLSYSPDIAPSEFFFSVSRKPSLDEENIMGKKNYEVGDEILICLSIEMIKMVFVDWMNRLQRLIDGNGDYIY
jgi:hypothetical protein